MLFLLLLLLTHNFFFQGGCFGLVFACFCFCFASDTPEKPFSLRFQSFSPFLLKPLSSTSLFFIFSFVPLGLFLLVIFSFIFFWFILFLLFFLFFFSSHPFSSFICSLPLFIANPFQTILLLGLGQPLFCLLLFDVSSVLFWFCLFLLLVLF